jgi:hypothetical protein
LHGTQTYERPATSFTPVSENEIIAQLPEVPIQVWCGCGGGGSSHVRVTTPGGTSAPSGADVFTYVL